MGSDSRVSSDLALRSASRCDSAQSGNQFSCTRRRFGPVAGTEAALKYWRRLREREQQFPLELSTCMEGSAVCLGRLEIARAAAGFRRCLSLCARLSILIAICIW